MPTCPTECQGVIYTRHCCHSTSTLLASPDHKRKDKSFMRPSPGMMRMPIVAGFAAVAVAVAVGATSFTGAGAGGVVVARILPCNQHVCVYEESVTGQVNSVTSRYCSKINLNCDIILP